MTNQIGPYQLIREIGRGGMGVVHLARDTRLDRDVAIKELPELFAQDPIRLERFEREAKALAALSHINLAGIYGVEEQAGSKYLILEYHLAVGQDFSPSVATEVAVEVNGAPVNVTEVETEVFGGGVGCFFGSAPRATALAPTTSA